MTMDIRGNAALKTVNELINVALRETDEETRWQAISSLHWKGTREVLQRAKELCDSLHPQERCLGADILGQLGVPDRTFPAECIEKLRGMLQTSEQPTVLQSVLIALSYHDDAETLPAVLRFANHPDAKVRHSVVLALSCHQTPLAIEGLILLSRDSDHRVRDWATFALGTQSELDTPEIRQALVDRLNDSDEETRAEAIVGLAQRKDLRVVEPLKRELSFDCVGVLVIEAAERIASKELYADLVALREWWDLDAELLERAISASQA